MRQVGVTDESGFDRIRDVFLLLQSLEASFTEGIQSISR